ncbi:hypothetical protein SALWKB29_0692 [Snodgrassella communis]|uniref:Uncharacterized protein n=1 Tax=Snodgrassella communis TaxID=2946699 RepID=A0A836MQ41_9NEIS|nr:hypothetical protein SALWKB29_0692 [Snodgrassella communis]
MPQSFLKICNKIECKNGAEPTFFKYFYGLAPIATLQCLKY